ncbi:MAG: FHA domain-containing protein [Ruminococcus sp.]|nr:FHA domain-containing protein [Ruminococcus sp.]
MQLTRCINNHFYDADKFQSCPHCGAAPDSNQAQGQRPPQQRPPQPIGQRPPQRPMQQRPPQGRPPQGRPPIQPAHPPVNRPGSDSLTQPSGRPIQGGQRGGKPTPAPQKAAPVSGGNLGADVEDVQKTVGIFVNNKNNTSTQPVVGWLVCVDGDHFGEDFRICMGRNFIGRAKTMDIVLSKDAHVSRDKHAVIVYEPKNNMFVIQAGESKELTYLNEEVVLSPKELAPYDTITLGSTKLLFVPFCSDKFKWEQVDKSDEE